MPPVSGPREMHVSDRERMQIKGEQKRYHSGCPRVDSRFWVLVSQSYYRSPRGRLPIDFSKRLVRLRGTGWSWRSAVTNLSDSLSRSQGQTSTYLYLEYPFVAPAARMLGHWSNLLPESQDVRRPELLGAIIRGSTLFYCVPHPSLLSVQLGNSSSRDMRLSRVLPALGLLFGVRASQLDSRVPHTLDARDPLDVCASLNTELVVPDLLGILTAVGVIGASTVVSKFTRVVF